MTPAGRDDPNEKVKDLLARWLSGHTSGADYEGWRNLIDKLPDPPDNDDEEEA